jgi:hypothetical protein
MKLKAHIDSGKAEANRIEGQITQLEQQRATDFACSDDQQAEDYIRELETDVAALEREITEGVAAVKGELGW